MDQTRNSSRTIMYDLPDNCAERAEEFLATFVCDVTDNGAENCQLVKRDPRKKNIGILNEMNNFIDSMLVINTKHIIYEDIIFFVLESIIKYMDGSDVSDVDIQELFKTIQDESRKRFFLSKGDLYEWASKNEYWVNRSLKSINNPTQNRKMLSDSGHPTMELIFSHAQNQFIYWTISEVINLLSGGYA